VARCGYHAPPARPGIGRDCVLDQGPGIPTADLDRTFDKFYRVQAQDRRHAGTGLGLPICRGFVEALAGSYLRVFVRGLRQKLEPDPTRLTHILTEFGVGYRLQLPPE
jgi:signal transduction histidine kinase